MGKIAIYWTPAGSNEEKLVGASGVINVFPEVDSREVSLPFDQGITVSGGTMRVVYSGNDDGPDKGVVFADQSFNTPR